MADKVYSCIHALAVRPEFFLLIQAALAQMELSAEQAADAYKRMKLLHDNGSLPEIKWVEVQTRYQQAKDAVRLAKATVQAAKAQKNISQKNLSDTRLYAPSAGFLSKKITEVGQNVAPGQPVATLVDIQQVKVKINVAEDDRAKIHVGQTFRFTVSSLPGKTFVAYVTEIGRAFDCHYRSGHRGCAAHANACCVGCSEHHPHFYLHFVGAVLCVWHRIKHRNAGSFDCNLGYDRRQFHRHHRQLHGIDGRRHEPLGRQYQECAPLF